MKNEISKSLFFNSVWPFLWFAFLIIVTFLRLITGSIILHWDVLSFDLPRSLFMSDAFRAGIIPLWNPYQDCGTAFFSDPLSGMWYPVSHLIIWTSGYSISALGFEYLLHVFIAGCGALWLARRTGLSRIASTGAATAYMLSGIFIGHAQHPQVIIGFSWAPFMFAAAEGMAKEFRLRDAVIFALVLAMQNLGGYPAVSILSLFFSVIYFFIRTWQERKEPESQVSLFRSAAILSLALILGLGLSSIILVPSFTDLPFYSNRMGGQYDYEAALNNEALPVSALVSLVIPCFPLLGLQGSSHLGADPSMMTLYFSILAFLLSLFALVRSSRREIWLWAGIGLAALLFSFGGRGILRALSIELLPLFGSFRHSALFRSVFILAFSIIAGMGIEHIIFEQPESRKKFRKILGIAITILIITMLAATSAFITTYELKSLKNTTFRNILINQVPLSIIILFLAYLALARIKQHGRLALAFVAIIGLDSALAVQSLNYLVGETPDRRIKTYLEVVEKDRIRQFPAKPRLNREDNFGEYDITGCARKVFQTGNYNVFRPMNYQKVAEIGFHKVAAMEPRFYLSGKVSVVSEESASLELIQRASRDMVFPVIVERPPEKGFEIEPGLIISRDEASMNAIRLAEYSLNSIKLDLFTPSPALLASTEGYHPGWQVEVDGKHADLVRVNMAFLGVYINSPGRHKVEFRFRPTSFRTGAIITIISLAVIIGMMAAMIIKSKKSEMNKS